jgi:hypothetical protein
VVSRRKRFNGGQAGTKIASTALKLEDQTLTCHIGCGGIITTHKVLPMRRLSRDINKLIIVVLVLFLTSVAVSGCISTEQVEQSAYNHVLEELRANDYPTGMFGATWYMTQQDLRNTLSGLYQLDANTLAQTRVLYDRSIQESYHFKSEDFNNRLWLIVVSFTDEFQSPDQFSTAFYRVQD